MARVSFVGAGPGDPELITIRGRRRLEEADVVVYAGSLVNPEVLSGLGAELHDSAGMDLAETTAVLREACERGLNAVRLHSGDVSFYSAMTEQIHELAKHGIEAEVVPGVSSLAAGSAAIGQELTIPEVSQTVIVTRLAGRTPVPEKEALHLLAAHGSTLVIFLSVGMIGGVVDELRKAGLPEDTPAAVVEKASWPEERVIRGSIADIAAKVKDAGITKTALIYVGRALGASLEDTGLRSRLYDSGFSHEYRK